MIWLCLALSGFAVGLGLGALYTAIFQPMWVEAMRADLQKKLLDRAFSDGYLAGKADGERKVDINVKRGGKAEPLICLDDVVIT